MRYLLVVICLLRAWPDANSTKVTGYEGGGISIRCNYSEEYKSNSKYLCKDDSTPCKDLIRTEKKNEWVTEERLSLYDDPEGGFFTVNITGLQPTDTGTYWCGVDQWLWLDKYTKVSLEVLKGPDSTKTNHKANSKSNNSKKRNSNRHNTSTDGNIHHTGDFGDCISKAFCKHTPKDNITR